MKPICPHQAPRVARARVARGFTLVEAAICLVLLALASATVITILQGQQQQQKIAQTDAILASARDALLAFETSYGYLPCPATAASKGAESVASIVGGIRTCTVEAGFLPAVTLGMPNLDAWGLLEGAWHDGSGSGNGTYLRAIRYSVASLAGTAYAGAITSYALGAPNSPTQRTAVQTSINANNGLFVCYSSTGIVPVNNRCGPAASNTLAPNVAAIIWSLGYDAPNLANYSTDEQQNEAPTVNRVVISHTFTPTGAAGGPFDDQATWISYPALADRLVYAGFVQ
jgi:type II secretory pathway pseudopilin PulG